MTNLNLDVLSRINEGMLDELTESDYKEIVQQSVDTEGMTTGGLQYFPNYNRLIERDLFNLYSFSQGIQKAFPVTLLASFFDLDILNFESPNGYLEIIIELTENNVVCSFPLEKDFKYVSFYRHSVSDTTWFHRRHFLSYEKKAISYKTFVSLLLAISLQETDSQSPRVDDSVLTSDIKNLANMKDFVHLDGLYREVVGEDNLVHFNTLPFTYYIKQLNTTQSMYRLKFGEENTPSFKFKYSRNDVEGLGYRLTGIYFMDVLFNEGTVESITCYKYNGTLSFFQNTIQEHLLEEVTLFSKYLSDKYQQFTHRKLLDYDIVTDLRENVLNSLHDTKEGKLMYEHLLTNLNF